MKSPTVFSSRADCSRGNSRVVRFFFWLKFQCLREMIVLSGLSKRREACQLTRDTAMRTTVTEPM